MCVFVFNMCIYAVMCMYICIYTFTQTDACLYPVFMFLVFCFCVCVCSHVCYGGVILLRFVRDLCGDCVSL